MEGVAPASFRSMDQAASTIGLALWQVELVEPHPGPVLRGLIHSDGWRRLNRVNVNGRH